MAESNQCQYCDKELEYHDYYGRICSHQDGYIAGNIYICVNEDCECQATCRHFHDRSGEGDYEIREGYPC